MTYGVTEADIMIKLPGGSVFFYIDRAPPLSLAAPRERGGRVEQHVTNQVRSTNLQSV
jgi:hypothetical protein